MRTVEIRSLADALALLGTLVKEHDGSNAKLGTFLYPYEPGCYPFHIWFRGEPDKPATQLQPSVFRPSASGRFHDEVAMFSYARSRYAQFRSSSSDILGSLCKMQHYRVPTRLLDWT